MASRQSHHRAIVVVARWALAELDAKRPGLQYEWCLYKAISQIMMIAFDEVWRAHGDDGRDRSERLFWGGAVVVCPVLTTTGAHPGVVIADTHRSEGRS